MYRGRIKKDTKKPLGIKQRRKMPLPLGLQIIQLASQQSVISGERILYSCRLGKEVMVRDLLILPTIVIGKQRSFVILSGTSMIP